MLLCPVFLYVFFCLLWCNYCFERVIKTKCRLNLQFVSSEGAISGFYWHQALQSWAWLFSCFLSTCCVHHKHSRCDLCLILSYGVFDFFTSFFYTLKLKYMHKWDFFTLMKGWKQINLKSEWINWISNSEQI